MSMFMRFTALCFAHVTNHRVALNLEVVAYRKLVATSDVIYLKVQQQWAEHMSPWYTKGHRSSVSHCVYIQLLL